MEEKVCTAGFARLDITPPLGVSMIGAGPRHAKGVLDPLYVNAVAFGDGEKSAVLLVTDLLGMYGKLGHRWPAEIAEHLGLPAESVILCCTHTHTGPSPSADKEYFHWLFRRLCDAATMALDDRKPVEDVRFAEGMTSGLAFVRRYLTKSGTVVSHPHFCDPELVGPVSDPDESMRLVRILRQDAPEIALVSFQAHADTVGGEYYSADWPGAMRDRVEAVRGSVRCVLLNGALGNLVTGTRMKPYTPKSHAKATQYGVMVAHAALDLFDRAQPTGMEAGPAFDWKTLDLPAKQEGEKGYDDHYPEIRPVSVCAITFCGLAIVGIGGEPLCEIGQYIREHSPCPVTCVCCQANGSDGYFPMAGDYDQPGGSYEPRVSHVQKGSGEVIMKTAAEMLSSLQ